MPSIVYRGIFTRIHVYMDVRRCSLLPVTIVWNLFTLNSHLLYNSHMYLAFSVFYRNSRAFLTFYSIIRNSSVTFERNFVLCIFVCQKILRSFNYIHVYVYVCMWNIQIRTCTCISLYCRHCVKTFAHNGSFWSFCNVQQQFTVE